MAYVFVFNVCGVLVCDKVTEPVGGYGMGCQTLGSQHIICPCLVNPTSNEIENWISGFRFTTKNLSHMESLLSCKD